jgi:predicted membrane protein
MSQHRPHQGRIFWGLVLVMLGVLFIMDRAGDHEFGFLISRYWPVILIILGFSMLVTSGFRQAGPGIFFVLFGAFFLLRELDILEHDVWHYIWPALIIALGLWLLLRPAFRFHGYKKFPEIKDNDIDVSCVLSGMKRRIESQNFRGGHVTAVLGGVELDFTDAGLDGGKATIDVTAIMGGVEIIVPKDWRVVIDGTPILGGFDDKHKSVPEAEAKASLYIKGTAIFGAITIKD